MNFHVGVGCTLRSIVQAFEVARLLALAKPFGNIWSIAMGEVLYWLVSRIYVCSFMMFSLVICHFINVVW